MTFDLRFRVLRVIFQLGTISYSIRHGKMVLSCEFRVFGIKPTVGHLIFTFLGKTKRLIGRFIGRLSSESGSQKNLLKGVLDRSTIAKTIPVSLLKEVQDWYRMSRLPGNICISYIIISITAALLLLLFILVGPYR